MGAMSDKRIGLLPGLYITPTQKLWWRNATSGGWSETVISDYLSGYGKVLWPTYSDAPYDLFLVLADQLSTDGFSGSVGFSTDQSSSNYGKAFLAKHMGVTAVQLSARNPAGLAENNSENIWWLLFPELAEAGTWSLSVTGSSGVVVQTYSARTMRGAFLPKRCALKDLTARMNKAVQAVSDDGYTFTVFLSAMAEYILEVGVQAGIPWGLVYNEFHALQDFLDVAAEGGCPTLIVMDYSPGGMHATIPYDRREYPFGFVFGQLIIETGEWLPDPESENYYGNWKKELRFRALPRVA